MISAVVLATALYSALVLDQDTVACFHALHDTRLGPKYTAKAPVERRSSRHPAQSASEKPLTSKEDDLLICNPSFIVCFRYLNNLLTAAQ